MTDKALVFGATGTLGSSIASAMELRGIPVVRVTRNASPLPGFVSSNPSDWPPSLIGERVSRVVFAQGKNASGGLDEEAVESSRELFEANVGYVISSLNALKRNGWMASPCRIVILGSVWTELARPDKLAYVTSKAAVGGLTRALAADLGPLNISVNAVLPGVVDSPMTREFLSPEALERIERESPLGRLVTPEEVAEVCVWLTSPQASGLSGQSIAIDAGWGVVRYV